MKYFVNITTAEELKKEFRALSIKLHPDRGGDAEEFTAMMSEYASICKNFESIKERQQAEREAEEARKEWARREAERKAEEERKAKEAAEAFRPIIAKWSKILERVPAATDYRSTTKEKAAYGAAVKRNLKAVFVHYFPGVSVKISRNTETWKEKTVISWVDGPTLAEVQELDIWGYFRANCWESDPYADYGHHVEIKETKAWREMFGESYEEIAFNRDFSEIAKGAMLRTIWATIPSFEGCKAGNDEKPVTLDDLHRLFKVCYPDAPEWRNDMTEEERKVYYKYRDISQRFARLITYYSYSKDKQYLRSLIDLMAEYWAVPADVAAEAKAEAEKPVFTPTWGATVKAINKAIGTGYELAIKEGRGQYKRVNLLEALEAVARGEVVNVVSWSFCEHSQTWSPWVKNSGGRTPNEKRKPKFAALGLTVADVWSTYNPITIAAVTAETLEAVRREFAEVEEQRKAWDKAQSEPKAEKKTATASAQAQTVADNGEAPAEGLKLVEIAEGVAVVGDTRTTYSNRKQIKAHGATWNKAAQRWEGVTPEAVESLRQWFGITDDCELWDTDKIREAVEAPLHEAEDITDTAEAVDAEPVAEDAEEIPTMSAEDLEALRRLKEENERKEKQTAEAVARVALALVDLCQMLADVAKAQQEETDRARKEAEAANEAKARKAARAQEVQTLREGIATLSAQLATMSEQLRKMSDRLAELTADTEPAATGPQTEAEAPQEATAETFTPTQEAA